MHLWGSPASLASAPPAAVGGGGRGATLFLAAASTSTATTAVLRKKSLTIELRLKAQAEASREAQRRLKMIVVRFLVGLSAVLGLILLAATDVLARETVIEEVHAPVLEKLISTKESVAVFWYSRNCKRCDDLLDDLQDFDAKRSNVVFVKINDKRLAKVFGIKALPALSFFRNGDMTLYEGDLSDEDDLLDFLKSRTLLLLPDKIEEVNAEVLSRIVQDEPFVTVLFFDASLKSQHIIADLESIDDEADVFKIRFLKIQDLELAEEYSLKNLPSLVYFRRGIPLVYHGDLDDEEEVLEWLIQHQSSVQEEDVLEQVSKLELDIMVNTVDHLLVLFHDDHSNSAMALQANEQIDDDCDHKGVSFVKVDDPKVAKEYGIKEFPSLVYFEGTMVGTIFDGDIYENKQVLDWLDSQIEGAHIEQVRAEMLEKMIGREEKIAVLFYDASKDIKVLERLEEIDDDIDELHNLLFVKSSDAAAAAEYGIEALPALVVFENGIPNMYQDDLSDEKMVLDWLTEEISGDHTVEVVTDAMLERLIREHPRVAVFFYQKQRSKSQDTSKYLAVLEEIDSDIKTNLSTFLVKIDDMQEAKRYGIAHPPGLVFIEEGIPNVYQGDLSSSAEILQWLSHLCYVENIEEVNAEILERLIAEHDSVAAYIYDASVEQDVRIAKDDLEHIDDDLEGLGTHLVKLADDGSFADRHAIDVVPALVLFRFGKSLVFPGDVSAEHDAVNWIKEKIA